MTTLDDSNINSAVTSWLSDAEAATSQYGAISDWDVSRVTNMYVRLCS